MGEKEKRCKNEKQKEWMKWGAIIFSIILGIILGNLCEMYLKKIPIAFLVSSVGIITFVWMLMFVNYLSCSPDLTKGEMRKAIATSFIFVYFIVMPSLIFNNSKSSDPELSKTIIKNFTYLMGIIMTFYFGSRTVEKYLEVKKEQNNKENQKMREGGQDNNS